MERAMQKSIKEIVFVGDEAETLRKITLEAKCRMLANSMGEAMINNDDSGDWLNGRNVSVDFHPAIFTRFRDWLYLHRDDIRDGIGDYGKLEQVFASVFGFYPRGK